ncbi:MAG: hypothetical protein HZA14_06695 [Nitrospirae bacterium]|nr:hypothetical protein [Nitrospirota bacterium]
MKTKKHLIKHSFIIVLCLGLPVSAWAVVTGTCSNCHTMHNSQNGAPMNLNNSSAPNKLLTKGDCLGCHGTGGGNNIDPATGAPQVLHTNATDLAGGNFKYIETGGDNRGHNVVELGNTEDTIPYAPGHIHQMNDYSGFTVNVSCAGRLGCHGTRQKVNGTYSGGNEALKGTHHGNVDGKLDTADTAANSYRFLRGVKGYENMGTFKWQNKDADNHNEYLGATTPMNAIFGCTPCHVGEPPTGSIEPVNHTISGFCATCHRDFHIVPAIGGDTTSPFTRHPTDVVLPNAGEYANYNQGNSKQYRVDAPVARTTVPDSIGNTVTPGADVVMCLSCHVAHASNYPDMLRWDPSAIIAGNGTNNNGCIICHTQKDDGI